MKLKLLMTLGLLLPAIAMAEVAPFGQAVGTATLDSVKQSLGKKTDIRQTGTSKWTDGPILESSGAGLGLEGLQSAMFIFDPNNVLVAVLLELPKHRYANIKGYLQDKYKMVGEKTAFVGNQSATFREGPVTIEADAPHMSFTMSVRYLHARFQEAHNRGQQREQQQQQQRESSQL